MAGEIIPPKGSDFWLAMVERRINELSQRCDSLAEQLRERNDASVKNSWDIEHINKRLDEIRNEVTALRKDAVSPVEHALIKKVLFGAVSLVLVGFMSMVVKYFLTKGGPP